MTEKAIGELGVGDFVADMHYGEAQLHERFEVVAHVRWEEPRDAPEGGDGYPAHAFFRYLGQFKHGRAPLMNKELVVLDWTMRSSLGNPEVVCGYCYDGRRSGLVVLRAKKDQPAHVTANPDAVGELRSISAALAELMNLRAAADDHKRDCGNPCAVSMRLLRQTATRLRVSVKADERAEAQALLDGWPL